MIDMLMQGNEEIQRFRQRAQDLGIVMSVDMMNAMEEYNDRSEDFEAVIFGIKTQIANALILHDKVCRNPYKQFSACN
jgi:hypothetical protein